MLSFQNLKLLFLVVVTCFVAGIYHLTAQPDPATMCSHAKKRNMTDPASLRDEQHPKQEDYSVVYYDLNLILYPENKTISGNVGIDVQIIADSTNQIILDLTSNYQVSKITGFSEILNFSRSGDLIFIQLNRFYKRGELLSLEVFYHGAPATSSFNFHTRAGKPLIWTLSQPFGAKTWWPCKNYPEDKADSARIAITVPKGLIVGSNGRLTAQNETEDQTEFVWKVSYPITSYLISIAAHDYLVHKNQYYYGTSDSMDVVHFIYRDHFETEKMKYEITTEMLTVFASLFGEYPFTKEKYGHAECPFNGGMEHQTLTSLLGPYEYLIAHELAHQWWGNMITCKDFHHIWLNEGFATYSEALWAEFKYGTQAYHDNMKTKQYLGNGTIYVPDLTFSGRIFDANLSYRKGAWVLHMLRHVVGTDHFFRILKTYGDGPKKFGVATTPNFQMVCESVSGMDLSSFFNQWIYGEGHPVYGYDWVYTFEDGRYKVLLQLYQLQAGQLFTMPLDIHIETASGEILRVIQNHGTYQEYMFELTEEPLALTVDKNNWVLKEIIPQRNFINHNNGNMILSVFNNGSLGFDKPNGEGNGLIYPKNDKNLLYSGSFIAGNKPGFTLDNDIVTGVADFKPLQNGVSRFSSTSDEQLGIWVFDDSGHSQAMGLEVKQLSRSYNLPLNDEYIILDYFLYNRSNTTLENLFCGVILDLDIGYYLHDQVGINSTGNLIYQKNGHFVGISSLGNANSGRLVAITDPQTNFKETAKFDYLSGFRNDFIANQNNDWAIMNSTGPFSLEPGDSVRQVFVMVAGNNEQDLIEKTNLAKQKFTEIIASATTPEAQKKTMISLVPNPVHEFLEVIYEIDGQSEVNICIMDLSGREVQSVLKNSLPAGQYKDPLDVSLLQPGVYLVMLKTDKAIINTRFIKI